MRRVVLCCLALVVLAGSVASTDDHVVLVDDDVDFSTLRTFEIRDVRTTSRHPAIDSAIFRSVLRDAVQKSLVARGFKAAPKAALVVESTVRGVDVGVDRQGRPVEEGRGRRARQPNPNRREFTEGTLVIDVMRADTRALVWRGVYHDTDEDASGIAAALPKHAAKLLSRFPGRP